MLVNGRLAIIECYDVAAGSYHGPQSEGKVGKRFDQFFTARSGLRHWRGTALNATNTISEIGKILIESSRRALSRRTLV